MANAKQCDRCKSFYRLDISNEEDEVCGIQWLNIYNDTLRNERYDLCRTCRNELKKWLKGENDD